MKLYEPLEGKEFYDESKEAWTESNKLWTEAILREYGKIRIEWRKWNQGHLSCECHLYLKDGTVEIYGFKRRIGELGQKEEVK